MNTSILLEYNRKEQELGQIKKSIDDLTNGIELKKFKEEYIRLKSVLDKNEEHLHGVIAQCDIRNKEIKNLELEKESCEILVDSDDISSKKQDKIKEQVKKVNEKIAIANEYIIKHKNEENKISSHIIKIKKKMNYIKKKYNQEKSERQEKLQQYNESQTQTKDALNNLSLQIGAEDLKIYNRIKRSHNNPISQVSNRYCMGCKMELSSLGYEATSNSNEITRCENCGRILVRA